MANRALVVEIVGDDRKLQQAFARSTAAAKTFSADIGRSLSSGVSVQKSFDPLLSDVKTLQGEADGLTRRLDTMGQGFEGANRGAGLLNAGLIGVLGRATAFGFAVSAAYQASQRLSQALQQTGEAAFTTEGRLRNMGSALIQGDILGAFVALRAQPKTLEDLGISATEARNRLSALQAVATGTTDQLREGGAAADDNGKSLRRYSDIVKEAGTSNRDLARQLVDLVASIDAADNAQNALADSTARLGSVFRTTTGDAVAFKGAVDDLGGLRGPGAVDAINAALEQARGGFGKQISPGAARTAKETIAQAKGDLQTLLALQKRDEAAARQALAGSNAVGKDREALNQALAAATAAVIATQKAIKANAEAEQKAAAAAAKAAAQAKAAALAKHWQDFIAQLDLGLSRAELTPRLNDDLARLNELKVGLEKQVKAGVDVQSAQARLVTVQGQIAAKQEEIRQKALDAVQARQFRSLGLSATGDDPVPEVENLAKRLKGVLGRIASGDLDVSSKLTTRLKAARRDIARDGDSLTKETRRVINEFINAATGKDSKLPDIRHVTLTDKILKALGFGQELDPSKFPKPNAPNVFSSQPGARSLAAASVSTANQRPIVVETQVLLDGDVIGRAITRHQQKRAAGSSATARGRFPGRNLGLG